MSFKATRLPNEPIIVVEMDDTFKSIDETPKTFVSVDTLIGTDQSVFLIYWITLTKIPFTDIVPALAEQTRKIPGSASDPRVKKVIVVGDHPMIKLSSGFLKQAQYGKIEIAVFSTLDEALAFARSQSGAAQ
jgi:hypothetical protein